MADSDEFIRFSDNVYMKLFDVDPKLITLLKPVSANLTRLCESMEETLTPHQQEDYKTMLSLENVATGGAIQKLQAIGRNDFVMCFKHILTVVQNHRYTPDYFEDAPSLINDFNVTEIVKYACIFGSINIIRLVVDFPILDFPSEANALTLADLEENRWYLVRISTGAVLELFLKLIRDSKGPQPRLNIYNVMFCKLLKERDFDSIRILKRYGYLQPIVQLKHHHLLYVWQLPQHFVERHIRECAWMTEEPTERHLSDYVRCMEKLSQNTLSQTALNTDISAFFQQTFFQENDLEKSR